MSKKTKTQRQVAGDDDDDMTMELAHLGDSLDNDNAVAVQLEAALRRGGGEASGGENVMVAPAGEEDQDDVVQVAAAVVENDQVIEHDADNEEVEAVASVVEEDDNEDELVVDAEDAGDVNDPPADQAAVVVAMDVEDGDDVPEVEAVAIVEEPPRPKLTKISTKKKPAQKGSGKKSTSTSAAKSPKRSTASKPKASTSTAAAKKRKKGKSAAIKGGEQSHALKIDAKRKEAANIAREMLYEAVPRLPFPVNESSSDQCYVRNFGRLKVGGDEISSKFSTASALYPVGFSCDRYEFSPSHGRILKLRCSIIDGKTIGETGPIFRVMWGQGVDDDVDKVEYPYDPFTNSAPITNESQDDVFANIQPSIHHPGDQQVIPAVGMRVKSRFDKNQYYHGTITEVVEKEEGGGSSKSKKKKKKTVHATILYDDGSTEETNFPDPDITLVMPGNDDEVDEYGRIVRTELNGKPVHTTIGRTPLEAWSLALIKLGLIDEVIVDRAMEALDAAREASESEARGKKKSSVKPEPETKTDGSASLAVEDEADDQLDPDAEPITEEENSLRIQLEELKNRYDEAVKQDGSVAEGLADARISLMGPLAYNPFPESESSTQNQASFLAVAVRKEKAKMGSTGNRKKIVNATDLLERSNTFGNGDVEALMEGLPGSEYCLNYIFLKKRGSSTVSKGWIQEQQQRVEREKEREKAKQLKLSKEAKAKASQLREKERKRKKIQVEREARKKQKLEEEEGLRKQREEARLAKLAVQVEDRLAKEANAQRERVVVVLAKSLNREMNRRRKQAELVAGQVATEMKAAPSLLFDLPDVPALGEEYDEDILRIWDFLNTFAKCLIDRKFLDSPPSLDALQASFDTLKRPDSTKKERSESISFLTKLAVSMCKPLAVVLTRLLFASLIALNPTIQKEFNAAYWMEDGSARNLDDDEPDIENAFTNNVLLPVNDMTWKEIARLAFLSDALEEVGFGRQDVAHYLRGYRSTGHPNSKEARRLRKMEGFGMECLLQQFSEHRVRDDGYHGNSKIALLNTPSSSRCRLSDWVFYLHNIKAIESTQKQEIEKNLKTARELLGKQMITDSSVAPYSEDLESCLSIVKTDVRKAREHALQLLDKATGEASSTEGIGKLLKRDVFGGLRHRELKRPCMGQLSELALSTSERKNLGRVRAQYMADAAALKAEQNRQQNPEEEDDDDDDDDDDDESEGASNSASEVPSDKDGRIPLSSNDKSLDVPGGEIDPRKEPPASANGADLDLSDSNKEAEDKRIGKTTDYDYFCGDLTSAPELIRRCLAVLRTLTQCGPGEAFINPVDPQENPNYYEQLLRPMCLRESGLRLRVAARSYEDLKGAEAEQFLEHTVAEFARNIRLIVRNTIAYTNAGPMVVSAGGELLRIFERLLLDWVLAPADQLPSLDMLDDDLCVQSHPSDVDSTVLLCDGCEGKYNISRLTPPLRAIPQGEWYCPRCLSGRWWGDLDPRIGKEIVLDGKIARIKKCIFSQPEAEVSRPSLVYEVEKPGNSMKRLSLGEVDAKLKEFGTEVPPIKCLEAVAESVGYGTGIDNGRRPDFVPVLVNPNVFDAAAQTVQSSSVFRDSIAAAGTLMINDTEEMTAREWLRILSLLLLKCASSDLVMNVASEMESSAAEMMAKSIEAISKVSDFADALPPVPLLHQEDNGNDEILPQEKGSMPSCPAQNDEVNNSSDPSQPAKILMEDNGNERDTNKVEAVKEIPIEVVSHPSNSDGTEADPNVVNLKEKNLPSPRSLALREKNKRQKSREEGVAAFCIKNQLRSTISSFERETVSQAIEAALAPKNLGLSFAKNRCRGAVCEFCGLSDTALGTNLVCVPNETEWNEIIPHATKSRQTRLIADTRHLREQHGKVFTLTLRIGDELVSNDPDKEYFEGTTDGGMLEFLPRNPEGFQDELLFRYEAGIPFITGSMSGHECCGVAAHNARKIKVVEKFKEKEAVAAEREAGIACGRTLQLGVDTMGRSYWHFNTDLGTLFVCIPISEDNRKWRKFTDPETISSVIVSLGKDPVAAELRRTFPQAEKLLQNGQWSNLLMKRRFNLDELKRKALNDERSESGMDEEKTADSRESEEELYEEGEHVLVESLCGSILWDADVLGVARNEKNEVAYRVSYREWSSRYDEWVESYRVVEPSTHNKEVQEEMIQDRVEETKNLPSLLENLEAKTFLNAKDRLRGNTQLPDFHRIAHVSWNAPSNARVFAAMKAAILVIEAALPIGSVDNTAKGPWRSDLAQQWKLKVLQSTGPYDLMRCVLALEESIAEEWIRPDLGHLRTGLPLRAKALEEATPSSVAIRVILLDRSIAYKFVDKKKFKSSIKKK